MHRESDFNPFYSACARLGWKIQPPIWGCQNFEHLFWKGYFWYCELASMVGLFWASFRTSSVTPWHMDC